MEADVVSEKTYCQVCLIPRSATVGFGFGDVVDADGVGGAELVVNIDTVQVTSSSSL